MQLPTIQEDQALKQAVDAKQLYEALGLNTSQWARWSKQNIQDNPFALEGTDYGVYDMMSNTPNGRPSANYLLSMDFAKKLAMQVRTEKGEQVRDYFLECERKAANANQPAIALPDFTNPAKAAIAWAEQYEATEEAQAQLAAAQPKIIALQTISSAKGELGVREAAKAVGMRQNEFVAWCIDEDKPLSRRFMYRGRRGALRAYSHRIDAGLITEKLELFIDHKNEECTSTRVKFTPAGITKIAEMLAAEGVTSGTEAV